ncbi:MAG TPA: hypothetical protein VIY90_15280 [Steroidobacteraceae bacterium]
MEYVTVEHSNRSGNQALRGAEVAASILRVDGDTGSYTGSFKDGEWVLSHFDGSRPGVITIIPQAEGTLQIQQHQDRPDHGRLVTNEDPRFKGLAIVAPDFEEPDQQGSLEREHAFVKQHGVKYTYLIAGAPEEMWEKVPQRCG